MSEVWKGVPGWDNYEASTLGKVKSLAHWTSAGMRGGSILRGSRNSWGRIVIRLSRDGTVTRMLRSRVIMLTFVGPCPVGLEVCHNDGDPANDSLDNLRYDTHRANQIDTGKYHLPLEQRIHRNELDCEINDCSLPQTARKMCSKHYNRWYRTGSPYLIRKTPNGGLPDGDVTTVRI